MSNARPEFSFSQSVGQPAQMEIEEDGETKPSPRGPALNLTFIRHLQHTGFQISYYCPHFTDELTEAQKG